MKLFRKGQKGLTLVELMVVMAILAVLASIIMPAVSGTAETSKDSQVKSDAGLVATAVNDFYADVEGAEVITSHTHTILGASMIQTISTKFPEKYLDAGYPIEFQNAAAVSADNVTNVEAIVIKVIGADGALVSENATALAAKWNAIDLAALQSAGYIPAVPKSAQDTSDVYHNYLWLVEKTTTASGDATVESRDVGVFKLATVETDETTKDNTITYVQVY